MIAELKRRLVRRINIWIPIYDDSCFNFEPDGDPLRIKRDNCQELGELKKKIKKVRNKPKSYR